MERGLGGCLRQRRCSLIKKIRVNRRCRRHSPNPRSINHYENTPPFPRLPALAQTSTDEAAVKTTIKLMFDGMRKGDSTQIKNTFMPGASLQTIAKNKEGEVAVRNEDIGKFAASVVKQPPFALDERLAGIDVKIDAELATAWTPYVFYFQDKKSHCGVNAFTLVKVSGNWKIQSIIDTRRKDNCPDLPKP